MSAAPASTPAAAAHPQSRWLPRSLFGRMMAVLAGGLLVAQLLSAAINLAERDRLMLNSSGMQQAQRISDVVELLDSLAPAERERIVAVLSVPPLVLSLHDEAVTSTDPDTNGPRAATFMAMLRELLDENRPIQVETGAPFRPGRGAGRHGWRDAAERGPGLGPSPGPVREARAERPGPVLRTQVQLRDGRWARFDAALPKAADAPPWRLAMTLGVLLLTALVLSFIAVRWVTKPLQVLATAADALGQDIHRPPLPEEGPTEIRQATRAFNTMQSRLARFIQDRTRILAAMSHDLKTPITRMRLRAELLDDAELRERFEADLKEMQALVTDTLEFMRGLGGNEAPQAVDVMALLESMQADNLVMGRVMHIEGRSRDPLLAVASLFKRCLANLIDNAVLYGGEATVRIEDTPQQLSLRILDHGPGIPEAELEKVFEPFYRLEPSRNRNTGGTGLGLTIARNIAQTHGGDIVLRNRPEGGMEALLRLPRGVKPA